MRLPALFPARAGRVPRARWPGSSPPALLIAAGGRSAAARGDRGHLAGGDRAVPAVLAGALRGRGPGRGAVLARAVRDRFRRAPGRSRSPLGDVRWRRSRSTCSRSR